MRQRVRFIDGFGNDNMRLLMRVVGCSSAVTTPKGLSFYLPLYLPGSFDSPPYALDSLMEVLRLKKHGWYARKTDGKRIS